MKVAHILEKAWAWPFYKAYAGMFFVLLLFTFGILRGYEHLALAHFFTEDFTHLIYPFSGLLLIEILSLSFSRKRLMEPAYRFLLELVSLEKTIRFKNLLTVLFKMQMVSFLYQLFLLMIAIIHNQYTSAFVIIFFSIFKLGVFLWFLNRWISYPSEYVYVSRLRLNFLYQIRLYFTVFYIKHIVHDWKLKILLTKVGSFGILMIWVLLLETVDFYYRFIAIGIFLSFVFNLFIVIDLHGFIHKYGFIFKNLPLRRPFLYLQIFIVILTLMLPEIVFAFRNFKFYLEGIQIVNLIFFGFSVMLLLSGVLNKIKMDTNNFLVRFFWLMFGMFIYIMFDMPVFPVSILLVLLSYYFFYTYFYQFESVYKPD